MTVKEIAAAVQKTERSVQNWVKKLSEKNSLRKDGLKENSSLRLVAVSDNMSARNEGQKILDFIMSKSAASSPENPADYSLDEFIAIIEVGLGHNAAQMFRVNAEKANLPAMGNNVNVTHLYHRVSPEEIRQIVEQTARQATEVTLLHSRRFSQDVIEFRNIVIDLVIKEIVDLQKSITGKDLEVEWAKFDSQSGKDHIGMWEFLEAKGYIKKFINTLKNGGRLW